MKNMTLLQRLTLTIFSFLVLFAINVAGRPLGQP